MICDLVHGPIQERTEPCGRQSVGALTLRGFIAPFVLDGPINRDAFETYLAKMLVRELRPGDILVMDNLSSHKGPRVRQMIEAAGAELPHLPPYSPDLNPIENAFAKLKAMLRKAAGAHHQRSVGRYRPHHRSLPARRMRKRLQRSRQRCNLIEFRSSNPKRDRSYVENQN
jgi:transposase